MMDAPQRMTQMKNTGVQRGPLVPMTMLAVATGGIALMTARQPPWERDLVDMASPADPAAKTVQSFMLTPEIRENAEMASIVAKMHLLSVQVNDLTHNPSLTIHTVCFRIFCHFLSNM